MYIYTFVTIKILSLRGSVRMCIYAIQKHLWCIGSISHVVLDVQIHATKSMNQVTFEVQSKHTLQSYGYRQYNHACSDQLTLPTMESQCSENQCS